MPDREHNRLALAEALLAAFPDPIVLVDGRGLVRKANAAARELLPALRTGHPLAYSVRAPEILSAVAAAQPGRSVRVEHRMRVPVERIFEVEIAALPGEPVPRSGTLGIILVFRDLTATRRLERMRADFVANVSHELRTPLASLVGFIETLQGPAREDSAAQSRFLEIMRQQAWRMTRLIDDLLSLSRIEMREHVAPSAPLDLRLLAAQIVDALTPIARERGVEIVLHAADHGFTVLGEADELLRVIENLVENAVKYGESGGRVEVALARENGKIALSVRDFGPGIAPDHLPRLTERFYRVDVAESREKGGTGLGLAIVKHIVNRHRGHLVIASEPGRGATFTVSIPESTAGRCAENP